MKKGFTMIELIFVIVILGILAAVAVPRLTATRDDAEIAKAATNLTTLIGDISSYYTSQAELATSLKTMTNVQLAEVDNKPLEGKLTAAGKECLHISVEAADPAKNKPAILKVVADSTDEAICIKIHKNKGVKDVLEGSFSYTEPKTGQADPTTHTVTGGIAISGTGVKF